MPRRLSNIWILPVAAATMIVLHAIDRAASQPADEPDRADARGSSPCRRPPQLADAPGQAGSPRHQDRQTEDRDC